MRLRSNLAVLCVALAATVAVTTAAHCQPVDSAGTPAAASAPPVERVALVSSVTLTPRLVVLSVERCEHAVVLLARVDSTLDASVHALVSSDSALVAALASSTRQRSCTEPALLTVTPVVAEHARGRSPTARVSQRSRPPNRRDAGTHDPLSVDS